MKSESYVAKGRFGRESPIRTQMLIRVANPKRLDRPNMCDIIFYNYIDIIGQNRYCARKVIDDRVVFKFYDTLGDDTTHRFKMFSRSDNFKVGDPLAVNANEPEVLRFVSQFKYPVYYNASTDEYFIDYFDGKRKPLFNDETTESENNMNNTGIVVKNGRMIFIDGDKLRNLLRGTGKSLSRISRELGHADGTVGMCIKRNSISVADSLLIERKYKIRRDEYERAEPVKETAEQIKTTELFTEEIKKDLYQIIYGAVYEAMKKALE